MINPKSVVRTTSAESKMNSGVISATGGRSVPNKRAKRPGRRPGNPPSVRLFNWQGACSVRRMTSVVTSAINPVVVGPAKTQADAAPSDSGFSFDDLIDIVNPLQHIPIVSTLYRAITGDQIKTFPKLAGDALYGGVEGLVGSMADTIFQKITGKSVGDTVLA